MTRYLIFTLLIGCAPSTTIDASLSDAGASDAARLDRDAPVGLDVHDAARLDRDAVGTDLDAARFDRDDAAPAPEPVATFTLANGMGPTVTFSRELWRAPEVTVAQFRDYANAGYPEATVTYPNGTTFTVRGSEPEMGGNCTWNSTYAEMAGLPINCVTWETAMAYCAWLGARLPTEAEWEWGVHGLPNETDMTWVGSGTFGNLASRPSGDSVGNVSEWTADAYAPYEDPRWEDTSDPLIVGGAEHSVRGANFLGWTFVEEVYARYRRHAFGPEPGIGFICVYE